MAEELDDPLAYAFLSITYRILGDNLGALRAFDEVRRRDPRTEETVVAVADFLLRPRRHPNSSQVMGQVIKGIRSAPDAYAWVATLFMDRNRLGDAQVIVREGLRRVGPVVPLLRVQGVLHFRAARYEQALSAWLAAQRMAPRNVGLLINIGWAYARLNRVEEAVRVWHRP